MSTTNIRVDLKVDYDDGNTETFSFDNLSSSVLANVKTKAQAYNANITTAKKELLVSKDLVVNASGVVSGGFASISGAKIYVTEETEIEPT